MTPLQYAHVTARQCFFPSVLTDCDIDSMPPTRSSTRAKPKPKSASSLNIPSSSKTRAGPRGPKSSTEEKEDPVAARMRRAMEEADDEDEDEEVSIVAGEELDADEMDDDEDEDADEDRLEDDDGMRASSPAFGEADSGEDGSSDEDVGEVEEDAEDEVRLDDDSQEDEDEDEDEDDDDTLNPSPPSASSGYLPDHLFSAAFAPKSTSTSNSKSSPAAPQKKIRRKKRRNGPKDIVLGTRTLRITPTAASSASPAANGALLPSRTAQTFTNRVLQLKPGALKRAKGRPKAGWERVPVNLGSMRGRAIGPARGFARGQL
ncbi:unnamed protein product [Mycena citricolor]|uniref:Uncharacterized protein n=1 Tax=Mycena citricolor TaxID=2018698 RepID=A0AAD2K0D4_9AGAR|nr:unnamed protein product [Mycena citricolor]